MQVFAGCDGGGTKCTVQLVLCEHDEPRGTVRTTAGPANVKSDPGAALRNIQVATRSALEQLKVSSQQIEHFVFALAGAGDSTTQKQWSSLLAARLQVQRVSVIPDAAVLFAAAEIDQECAAIASVMGTGSMAWARTREGRIERAGGRGPLTSDQGSAYWIGHQATQRLDAFRTFATSEASIRAVAALAEEVFSITDSKEAERIIAEAAVHISDLIVTATNDISSSPEDLLSWICTGGVAANNPSWLDSIRTNCAHRGVFLESPVIIRDPVVGAVKLAIHSGSIVRL